MSSPFIIKAASREFVRFRIYVAGGAGTGKTLGTIRLLDNTLRKLLQRPPRLIVIDSENDSASYYAGDRRHGPALEFDTMSFPPPYGTDRYAAAMRHALTAEASETLAATRGLGRYDGMVVDSITHQWAGTGGILPRKEALDVSSRADKDKGFQNWARFTPETEQFRDLLTQCPIHLGVTVRAKSEYQITTGNANQRGKIDKIGVRPQQRDDLEYEFSVAFMLQSENRADCLKDRTGLFAGKLGIDLCSQDVADDLAGWVALGGVERPDAAKEAADAWARSERKLAQEEVKTQRQAEQPQRRAATPPAEPKPAPRTDAEEYADDLARAKALPIKGKKWEANGVNYGQKPIGDIPIPVLKQALAFFQNLAKDGSTHEWLVRQQEAISLVINEAMKDPTQRALFEDTAEEKALDARLAGPGPQSGGNGAGATVSSPNGGAEPPRNGATPLPMTPAAPDPLDGKSAGDLLGMLKKSYEDVLMPLPSREYFRRQLAGDRLGTLTALRQANAIAGRLIRLGAALENKDLSGSTRLQVLAELAGGPLSYNIDRVEALTQMCLREIIPE